jgi:hypothetical protein
MELEIPANAELRHDGREIGSVERVRTASRPTVRRHVGAAAQVRVH